MAAGEVRQSPAAVTAEGTWPRRQQASRCYEAAMVFAWDLPTGCWGLASGWQERSRAAWQAVAPCDICD